MSEEQRKWYCCKICGVAENNRKDWCDLGCGRDYNEIFEVKRMVDVIAQAQNVGFDLGYEQAELQIIGQPPDSDVGHKPEII